MSAMTENMRYLSNSEASTFKRCRRKWWLSWYRDLALNFKAPNDARAKGSRVHEALAEFYVPEGQTPIDPQAALEIIIARDAPVVEGDDEFLAEARLAGWTKETDLERAMLEGYVQWISETGVDEDLVVVASERSLMAQITDTIRLLGRLDVEVQLRSQPGVQLFMDHKTTGGIEDLLKRLNQDEQLLTYMLLKTAHQGENRIDGALYNILRKVKRSPRAKPPFYHREVIRFNDHQLSNFQFRITNLALDIEQLVLRLDNASPREQAQIAAPTPTKDCAWDCDFKSVCPMFDDGSRAEDMINGLFATAPLTIRYPEIKDA